MATTRWLGGAVAIPEVKTITVGGAWLAAEYPTLTINGKDLVCTLTSGDTMTTDQVAANLCDMINGAAANENEVRSALGSAVGEWAQLTATVASSVVTVTGKSDGQPIGTLTATDNSATGTLAVATPTTGTGPHDVNNADNWSEGSVPGAADDLIFDNHGAADCLYNLDQLVAVAVTSLRVMKTFKYQIGLPEINADSSSYPYDEFRETHFQVDGGVVTIDGTGAQMLKIDTSDVAATIVVEGTGTTGERNMPALSLKVNENTSTISIQDGSVGINIDSKATGTAASVLVTGNSQVEIGDTFTLTTFSQVSGVSINNSAVTTINLTGGTYEQREGAVTTANVDGGIVYVSNDATWATVNIASGAAVDATLDSRSASRAFTQTNLYKGGTIKDPLGTIAFGANGIDMYCKPNECVLDIPPRKTYVISAI